MKRSIRTQAARAQVLMLMVLLAACGRSAQTDAGRPENAQGSLAPAAATSPRQRLHALFDAAWQRQLQQDPALATYLGDSRYDDRWEDLSPQAIEARYAADRESLHELQAIDRSALDDDDQLNYDLFQREYQDRVDGQAFHPELLPMSQLGGVQLSAQILDFQKFSSVQDYEHWLARLQGFGTLVDQTIALMRRGVAEKRVHPHIAMRRVLPQVAAQLVTQAKDSPYYAPFRNYPQAVGPDVRAQLDVAAQAAILEVVVPAFQRLHRFLQEEYLPACPVNEFGLSTQPQGPAYYAWRVRHYTGTRLSPDEIHALGLREVSRLDGELKALMREAHFGGSLDEFQRRLSSQAQYRYQDSASLLEAYRALAKRIDPELPKLFGRLPRTPYGVRSIPALSAAAAPAAYYYPPSADGSRAGYFYANTDRPTTRPGWMMEALVAHEAVPGHHLQIALANELTGLPDFRRLGLDLTAFVEGWGLYAESLGTELGLYTDVGSRFGQLSAEMWRAVRLVVDTGLHAKGWSRKTAREYFAAHAPRPAAEIEVEVDRYIADPGQALAYKIGQLKILALRQRAQERLGERFDVRAFHDELLSRGPLPLDLLEPRMEAWIDTQVGVTAAAQTPDRAGADTLSRD